MILRINSNSGRLKASDKFRSTIEAHPPAPETPGKKVLQAGVHGSLWAIRVLGTLGIGHCLSVVFLVSLHVYARARLEGGFLHRSLVGPYFSQAGRAYSFLVVCAHSSPRHTIIVGSLVAEEKAAAASLGGWC